MSHMELLDQYVVVRIVTACTIIGGDGPPVSESTIYRLCREGQLERRGKGKVTSASLRRYLEEGARPEVSPPRASATTRHGNAARMAKSAPPAVPAPSSRIELSPRFPRGKKSTTT
jgi:hypothetical protein